MPLWMGAKDTGDTITTVIGCEDYTILWGNFLGDETTKQRAAKVEIVRIKLLSTMWSSEQDRLF